MGKKDTKKKEVVIFEVENVETEETLISSEDIENGKVDFQETVISSEDLENKKKKLKKQNED